MGSNLPSQLNGPVATAYMQATADEIAKYNASNTGIPYLAGLSISSANTIGTSLQELINIGILIGYPLPTISIVSTNGLMLGDWGFYPQTTSTIGLGDNVSTGGLLIDATASGVFAQPTAAMYRLALSIVAKIKRNGLTIAMVDALGKTFSTNYKISITGSGTTGNQFTLGDWSLYPQATALIGLGDNVLSGGFLTDATTITNGDITLSIYDNIGAIQVGIMQNIALLFSTVPQLTIVYYGT